MSWGGGDVEVLLTLEHEPAGGEGEEDGADAQDHPGYELEAEWNAPGWLVVATQGGQERSSATLGKPCLLVGEVAVMTALGAACTYHAASFCPVLVTGS